MKIYFLSFLILLFFSCQNEKKNKEELDNTSIVIESGSNENTNDENDFFKYLSNFETIELPITIKGCEDNFDKLKPFDGKTYNGFDEEYALAYGRLNINEDYIALLTLGAADCFLPILTTYDNEGNLISKETIAIGGCGVGCGFSCEEIMQIREDKTLYTANIIIEYECDDDFNEILETQKNYEIYREGILSFDGKINLSEEIKRDLDF